MVKRVLAILNKPVFFCQKKTLFSKSKISATTHTIPIILVDSESSRDAWEAFFLFFDFGRQKLVFHAHENFVFLVLRLENSKILKATISATTYVIAIIFADPERSRASWEAFLILLKSADGKITNDRHEVFMFSVHADLISRWTSIYHWFRCVSLIH